MHRDQNRLLNYRLFSICKFLSVALLTLAYLPMFFGYTWSKYFSIEFDSLKSIYEYLYATLTCYGVGFLLITKKKRYLVPLISMFFGIGTIFLTEDFCETFYPVFSIIIIMILCTSVFLFMRHKHNFRT